MSRTPLLRLSLLAALAVVVGGAVAPVASAHPQVPRPVEPQPVLLRGGDLHTVSGGVLPATDLLFVDGEITAIGKDLAAPAGAVEIDLRGRRVYPGLIALQTVIGLVEIGAVRATQDQEEVGDVTPEVLAHTAYNPDSEVIPTVRSHGITTVQVTPLGSLLRGRSSVLHLDGWTKEDAGVKLVDGLQLDWPAATVVESWWMPTPAEEQREAMAEQRRVLHRIFDQASAYAAAVEAGHPVETDLRLEAMVPVVRGEQPLYVTADDYRQIVEAVELAVERDLRLVIVGGREAYKATDLLKRHDVPVVVGSVYDLPLRDDDAYDQPYRLPALLHAAGVRFAIANAGSWDVRNLPFHAGQAVAFGLPPEAALRAITQSPAEILGIADRQGSLEVGKSATLFVSEGDVLDMLGQRVTHMWIDGHPVDLDNRHKTLYRKYDAKPAVGE